MEDPELVEQADKHERPFDYLSGEELQDVVDGLLDAPEEYVTVLEESFAESS